MRKKYQNFFFDGKKMKVTNEELSSIKNNFKITQDKIYQRNKLIKDKINQIISNIKLTEFQNKLYEKFDKSFKKNEFSNELLFYFIQMVINTYEQAFDLYPSQAIICNLRNYTDYINNYKENDINLDEIKNDVTKILVNAINYFKKNFIFKIYESEIDLKKIRNKANITITKDEIICLKYLNKYKTLLVGSTEGKIYCINTEQKNCFCQIQAHNEYEERTGHWGVMYLSEIEGNRLITCCKDTTMKLWEIVYETNKKRPNIDIKYITVMRGHRNMVRKVIQLKRGKNEFNKNIKLVSCSFDCCICFWEEKTKNKFELLNIIKSHEFWINEIHEIYNGKIFVIGGEFDPCLKIWDSDNFSFELIKDEKIFCVNHDCVIEINKDYYIIGGNHTYILFFRLSEKKVFRKIYIEDMYINSLFLLPDGNLLADSGRNAIKYIDLSNYEVKDAIITNDIPINWYLMPLDNKTFVSSDRECIRIWEF